MIIKLYLIALPVFFLIDMLWLGLVAKSFYAKHLGFLMKPEVNWVAAVLFYLLFIVGIVIFVVQPGLEKQSLVNTLVMGAFFGLVCYATYDLTNLATIKNWPVIVTIVDLIWGSLLTASVSGIVYLIANKLNL